MLFRKSNMKIIHWEYNEDQFALGGTGTPKVAAGCMRNIETNVPTGIWFRWTYLLQNGNNVSIHCVGQDSYKINDIPSYSKDELGLLMCKSFENFKEVFFERLELLDIKVDSPSFEITDELLMPLFQELKNQRN